MEKANLPANEQESRDPATWEPPSVIIFEESAELVINDENPEDEDTILNGDDDKPVRYLDHFVLFDSNRHNELVSLAALEEEDVDSNVEAAGFVSTVHDNDEDEGQEDDLSVTGESTQQYVKLGAVFRFTFDYTKKDAMFWIETEFSWYILGIPSSDYAKIYNDFIAVHYLAAYILSSVSESHTQVYDSFLEALKADTGIESPDFRAVVPVIRDFLDHEDTSDEYSSSPIVQKLLGGKVKKKKGAMRRTHHLTHTLRGRSGNLDLAVLRRKNLNPTHVTPFIGSLAKDLCLESLRVVGKEIEPKVAIEQKRRRRLLPKLRELVSRRHENRKEWRVVCSEDGPISDDGEQHSSSVDVNGETYEVGDVILTPIEDRSLSLSTNLTEKDDIAYHFWYVQDARLDHPNSYLPPRFASIVYIIPSKNTAHVRWFDHGFHIAPQELANSQELFLHNDCGDIPLYDIISCVRVKYIPPGEDIPKLPYDHYYCKFEHDHLSGAFTSFDYDVLRMTSQLPPPENCPVCVSRDQKEMDQGPREIDDGRAVFYQGQSFHLHDFVLFRSVEEDQPARIGQISKIVFPKGQCHADNIEVELKRLGRIHVFGDHLPPKEMKDERHLFMTPVVQQVPLANILQTCFVHPFVPITDEELGTWLTFSPDHFFVKYFFPSLTCPSWSDRKRIRHSSLSCEVCAAENTAIFRNKTLKIPLPAIDLFGGCGAFGLGLAMGSGCIEISHAVEIAPSAALTYQRNSPNTSVFNQCVNTVFEYAIAHFRGQGVEAPSQIFDPAVRVPAPPKPGDIKVVIAGFPCQTFSGLNAFKRNDDTKSNLFLNALSWVEFLEPDYAVFENVPGFLKHRLNARQEGIGRITGGLEQGGLKFLMRALLELGYQVRYGLLQAGNYGTPQSRVRFFMIAAKHGLQLPNLPYPTHAFPLRQTPSITLANKSSIRPILFQKGSALHPSVTINDAISDLPQFDWKDPHNEDSSRSDKPKAPERQSLVPSFECRKTDKHWGYEGLVPYSHPPRTRFQLDSRLNAPSDLQHFTRTLPEGDVRRVLHIGIRPDADYRGN
ncbi:hypothetical protein VNI00_002297 [Paramarasmius palmivorus]|uniref:DNA (cytosine-5-)-methyltransferase n=1 Tax=Paramarasmius palmivorus TaxID=297713 RepID=A0AAW0E0K9_9AGAR